MYFDALRTKFEKNPYLWCYVIGTALFIVSMVSWWFVVYLGPKHVFWSMVQNSLATKSVVTRTHQSAEGDSLQQLIHIDTDKAHMARSITTLKQGKTEVKTEILGTRDADYTRYLAINTDSKADTSKVKGVWSKNDVVAQTQDQASGHQLFAQATLGVGLPLGSVPVPIGDLPSSQRHSLYDFIISEGVYRPAFDKVKKEHKNGRLQYTYEVTVNTIPYIRMMQKFAKDLGLTELEAVDPNMYQESPTLTAKLLVDAYSHQLIAVDMGELGKTEYTSYGIPLKAEVPKETISAAELQKRLDALRSEKP